MKLKLFTFVFVCANAFAASQMVTESIAFIGHPQNQAAFPKGSCRVGFQAVGYGWSAGCLATAVCTPGSAFSRQTITTASFVESFCTPAAGPNNFEAQASILGLHRDALDSSAILWFAKAGRNPTAGRYTVFHDSYDGCNMAMAYHNSPMVKPCPSFE